MAMPSHKKRDRKLNCAFHRNIGHDTNSCRHLKDEIERLVRKKRAYKVHFNEDVAKHNFLRTSKGYG